MKYEKPLVTIEESEEQCNEAHSSGVLLIAVVGVIVVAIVTRPAY